jgi:ribosome biogenesis GTPase A
VVQQSSRRSVFPANVAPYIDVAAYLLDSRAPAATLWFDDLLRGKELMVLTRSDQADPNTTRRWQKFLIDAGYRCVTVDGKAGQGMDQVLDYLAVMLKRKTAMAAERGIGSATLRMVALGVPNVGKSTFLNTLTGQKRLKTGDKPGITKGPQWVRVFEDVEVLDTAGILREVAALNRRKPYWMLLNLMPYEHSVRDEAVELLISSLPEHAWRTLARAYKIRDIESVKADRLDLLAAIAKFKGRALGDDDAVDRASIRLIRDFQTGRLGRLTLEQPGKVPITSPYFNSPPSSP